MVVRKKSEGEDKVENDAKQKNKWEQKISTRLEYRKWVQKIKIENEYNLNTNQTCPKKLSKERGNFVRKNGFYLFILNLTKIYVLLLIILYV